MVCENCMRCSERHLMSSEIWVIGPTIAYRKTGESTDDTVNWSPTALLSSYGKLRAAFDLLVNIRPTPLGGGGAIEIVDLLRSRLAPLAGLQAQCVDTRKANLAIAAIVR